MSWSGTDVRSDLGWALILICGLIGLPASGDEVIVAVATNFALPMQGLETHFENTTPHEITAVTGSTGQLYAQVLNGAPYDIFLAADRDRPTRLVEQGAAVIDTQFTYALGQLTLWTREPSLTSDLNLDVLASAEFRRLAIANPRLAPYGLAAQQTLEALGLWELLQAKIVRGENVAQAFAMVETRNAELGLVAHSSVIAYSGGGAAVRIPATTHAPIRQDAVLLMRGETNPAALEFIRFLQGAQARTLISEAGYLLP